jgi:beta-lactamase class D
VSIKLPIMKVYKLLFILLITISACTLKNKEEYHPEFKAHFDTYEVNGSFLLYDFQKHKTLVYNKERCNQGFLPASTFKIANTLVGLEIGIITDENFVIPWDSIPRQIPIWNKDHQLKSAFQNSVVPWYQELARRIGTANMKHWIAKAQYGTMDITDENTDLFWLTGNSRISPYEQLDFQKRLVRNELPFREEHHKLVKKIMILESTPTYTFRGKTGWAVMENKNIGWLVGYLEKGDNKYAYVLNVESENEDSILFQKSRTEIVRHIFKALSLI